MSTELEHLRKMRELLANGWTQGAWARDILGSPCSELSPEARSFCVYGALYSAQQGDQVQMTLDLISRAAADFKIRSITSWNDMRGRKQSEVLALIDRAIEIAEAE